MKNILALASLPILLLTINAAPVLAQTVPQQMNFQGRLAKPDGTPVADAAYDVTFCLYDAATGGNLLWQESALAVATHNGALAVCLDFSTGFQNGATLASAFNGGAVYLDISVNGGASLAPRQQFVSNAYAFTSNTANIALTVPDGSITGAKIAAGTITADKLASGSVFGLPYSATVNSAANVFSLTNTGKGYAGYFKSGGPYGVYAETSYSTGVAIAGVSNNGSLAVGVNGNSTLGYGGYFIGGTTGVAGNSSSGFGVYGNSGSSYGVYGYSSSSYGVYGSSNSGSGVAGYSSTGAAGYFAGNLVYTGTLTHSSDARFKRHIVPLDNALDNVLALRGVSYEYRRDEFPDKNFARGTQYGFIAQEVARVLPDMVHKDKDGYLSLDYTQAIPVLVEAVKAQEKKIEKQKSDINEMKAQIAMLAATLREMKTTQAKAKTITRR